MSQICPRLGRGRHEKRPSRGHFLPNPWRIDLNLGQACRPYVDHVALPPEGAVLVSSPSMESSNLPSYSLNDLRNKTLMCAPYFVFVHIFALFALRRCFHGTKQSARKDFITYHRTLVNTRALLISIQFIAGINHSMTTCNFRLALKSYIYPSRTRDHVHTRCRCSIAYHRI